MLEFINYIKSLSKFDDIQIDNKVFKLHYKFTVIMLLTASILVTSKQYFGDPIDCYVDNSDLKSIIDTYCWITGTYVLERTRNDKILPGLGNEYERFFAPGTNNFTLSQKYYQWVCIFLCFQAMCFYIPRFLWKYWEQKRLHSLIGDIGKPIVTPSWTEERKMNLVGFIFQGKYSHNLYALRFFFCEILTFLNVLTQIFIIDWFLTGQFGSLKNIQEMLNGATNPFSYTFPKIAKCQFYKVGPSGGTEARDAICVLPLNVLNEKVFAVLWIWLYVLMCFTALSIIWHIFLFNCKCIRTYLLMGQSGYKRKGDVRNLVKFLSFGSYFLLHQIGKNINSVLYKELVEEMIAEYDVNCNDYDPKVAMQL